MLSRVNFIQLFPEYFSMHPAACRAQARNHHTRPDRNCLKSARPACTCWRTSRSWSSHDCRPNDWWDEARQSSTCRVACTPRTHSDAGRFLKKERMCANEIRLWLKLSLELSRMNDKSEKLDFWLTWRWTWTDIFAQHFTLTDVVAGNVADEPMVPFAVFLQANVWFIWS